MARRSSRSLLISSQICSLAELDHKISERKSHKRPEENYKFVFKRCLKYMMDKFASKTGLFKLKKPDFEHEFYKNYFECVAAEEKIPLETFYHPKNKKSKDKSIARTISTGYVQHIIKNQTFVDEFMNFMNNRLLKDYVDKIKKKLWTLVRSWEEQCGSLEGQKRQDAVKTIC